MSNIMLDLPFLFALLSLGALVGAAAGLLGIGGGGLMVPLLTSLFLWQGFPAGQVMHLALGTSMASIVTTSLVSMLSHHNKGGVVWPVVRSMVPGILVGGFLATFIVARIDGLYLAIVFALFMLGMATWMVFGKVPNASRTLPQRWVLACVGSGIGSISALVSIGGGALSVPYLFWHNLPLKKAIGTSAALGFPVAVAGTLGYLVSGWGAQAANSATLGFIYWPGVVAISVMSGMCAPLGVRAAYYLPVEQIKKVFALLLILLSAKMLSSVIGAAV